MSDFFMRLVDIYQKIAMYDYSYNRMGVDITYINTVCNYLYSYNSSIADVDLMPHIKKGSDVYFKYVRN